MERRYQFSKQFIYIYIYEMMLFKPVTVYLALAVNNVQLFNA